jgi:hypothetical protein
MFEENSLFDASDDGTFVPFTDVLFNVVMGFSFIVFIAFTLIKPNEASGAVNVKAELIVTVSWADNLADDIDTYVEDPGGNIVWYKVKEAGLLTLDRDDRGDYLDEIEINGIKVRNPLNQESVTLRGNVPGEFVVNVVRYTAARPVPIAVEVKVEKINPTLQVIYYGTVVLDHAGQEITAVRFNLDEVGGVTNVNNRAKSLQALLARAR